MEEVFMEWLDQVYWQGYAEAFRDNHPANFLEQFLSFNQLHI